VQSAKLCEQKTHTSSISDTDHWFLGGDGHGYPTDTVTYSWSKTAGTNPQTGTFIGDTDKASVVWKAPPCTGTVNIKLTANDKPDSMDNPCPGSTRNDSSEDFEGTSTVSLPGCATGTKSANLQAAEISGPDCSGGVCGRTMFWTNLGVNIFARYNNCKWVFQVTAVVDVASDPCPNNYVEIENGNDSDVTQSNFCTFVNGFYNGGSGNGGGDCFSSGGTTYGNSGCVEDHEDKHFELFYDRATGYEENALLQKSSMNDMTIDCSDSDTTTCQAAKSAREAAITADVEEAFDNAWWWMSAQDEPPAWAAEFPCAENLAKSICQRAQNEPSWDVDTCAQCVTWGYTD